MKLYMCPYWGKTSSVCKQRSSFINHVEMHSSQEVECSQCDKIFVSKRTLAMHIKQVHGEKLPCNIVKLQCGLNQEFPYFNDVKQ